MSISTKSVLGLAVAAAVAIVSSASASIIHYPTVTSGGLTVSNITETNGNGSSVYNYGDAGAPSYYGPATLTGTSLNFPITGTIPFSSSSSGPNASSLLGVKLAFDVTSTVPLSVVAFLSEVGDFMGGGGGSGGDDSSILIFDQSGNLITSSTGVSTPSTPFTTGSADTTLVWSSSAVATSSVLASSFHIVIDNLLHTSSPSVTSYAAVDKKELDVNIGTLTRGGLGTPEPASLGLVGLGAISLIARRRRSV
jgi:hypothetical protein